MLLYNKEGVGMDNNVENNADNMSTIMDNNMGNTVNDNVSTPVESNIETPAENTASVPVESSIDNTVVNSVDNNVENNTNNSVEAPVENNVDSNVSSTTESSTESNVEINTNNTAESNTEKPVENNSGSTIDKKKRRNQIITGIAGVFAVYSFFYVLYFVFLVPDVKDRKTLDSALLLANDDYMRMYEAIPNIDYSLDYKGAYLASGARIDTIDPAILLNEGYRRLSKDSTKLVTPVLDEYTQYTNKYCQNPNIKCFTFLQEDLVETLKSMYGEELTIEYQTFQIGPDADDKCEMFDNVFMCHEKVNSVATSGRVGYYVSAKESGNDVYIYEYALFLDGYTKEKANNAYNVHIDKVYKYANTDEFLLQENVDVSSPNEDFSEVLVETFKDKVTMFKSTFTKGNDGGYRWVSTEQVSSTEY